jgi:serine/threonine protein kinase
MNVTHTGARPGLIGSEGQISLKPHPGGLGGITAKSDGQARAAQQQMVEIANTRLGDRKITVDTVISRTGATAVLGKAGILANLRDKVVRLAYRISHRLAPDAGVGNQHKAAIRLAETCQRLKNAGAPEPERRAALNALLEKLHALQNQRGAVAEGAPNPVGDMIRFTELELSCLPGSHLEKAEELAVAYFNLMQEPASRGDKIALLTQLQDHLESANPEGRDEELSGRLADVTSELNTLLEQQSLEQELEGFAREKPERLKPVQTRQSDPIGDQRAKFLHEKFEETMQGTNVNSDKRSPLNEEVRSYDRSRLKHVETVEKTDLDRARNVFLERSHFVSPEPGVIETHPSLVSDPQFSQLTETSLGSEVFQNLGSNLVEALSGGDSEKSETLKLKMATVLSEDLSQLPQDVQLGFITSRGEAFKDAFLLSLSNQGEDAFKLLGGGYKSASPAVKKFVDEMYQHAVCHLSDRQLDENTCILDGETFTKVRRLNQGGTGFVDLYESRRMEHVDGEDREVVRQVAIKGSIVAHMVGMDQGTIDDQFEPSAVEVRAHRTAQGDGHPNVIGFRGAFLTPNGSIMVAMELAGGGDVDGFSAKLGQALEQGHISPQAALLARLTILQDMTKGMQYVQEKRGMLHLDIKPANMMIGSDGVAKVGDFGFSRTGTRHEFPDRPIDNVMHMAPEVIQSAKNLLEDKMKIRETQSRLIKAGKVAEEHLKGEDLIAFKEQLDDTLAQLDSLRTGGTFTVTEKSDTWALGMSAYQLFHANEHLLAPEDEAARDYMRQLERNILEFGAKPENRAGLLGTDGSGNLVGTGATELDRLLNQMLHPDPDMRPSFTELLAHPIFTEPGVDGDDVRQLIMALNDPETTPEDLTVLSKRIGI